MKLVLIDPSPESRAALFAHVQEGLRQAESRRLEPTDLDIGRIESFDWEQVVGCLLGPSAFDSIEEAVERIRMMAPNCLLGIVLEGDAYLANATQLRRKLGTRIISGSDLVQFTDFVLDCENASAGSTGPAGGKSCSIIGVCQFKGGVGATSVTAALAACWARHGFSVAAIDLDDVNPQLTAWARVGVAQKTVTAELLRQGEVPANRINELVHPVEGFEGRFVVVGQPEAYNEGFHFKANVLEGSPSSSEFMISMLTNLSPEFDVIVIDMARSWGVSSFAALSQCHKVLLVSDDDGLSVRRTLDCLARMKGESEDSEEFDLAKWSFVLNGFTGQLIGPKEVAIEIEEMQLFAAESSLFTLPFSESGRQWGAPGQSMYEMADEKSKAAIRKIAYQFVPFRMEPTVGIGDKIRKKIDSLRK